MTLDFSNYRTLVFAKEPILGFVKTRMRGALSDQQSLDLHKALTTDACENLARWRVCPSDIYYWQGADQVSNTTPVFLTALSRRLGLTLWPQADGNLGEKMSSAVASTFLNGVEGVLLLGADCPFITRTTIVELFKSLHEGADAAIVPAHDGGYVALALRCAAPSVFSGVDWGTDKVFTQTLSRFKALDWQYECLPALPDIDRPEDLYALKELESAALRHFMPG